MLRHRDSFTLAITKLRVRPIRLIVTLIVSGVLFTVLVAGSLLIRGTIHSLESFASDGLLKRFITATFSLYDYESVNDSRFIKRAEELDKQRLDAQVREAKRLGLNFNPATAPKAITEFGEPGHKQKTLDLSQPAAQQAFIELSTNNLRETTLKAAAPYHPQAIYEDFRLGSQGFGSPSFELAPIVAGQEQKIASLGSYGRRDAFESFQNSLSALDNGMLKPFLLDNINLTTPPGDPVPILAPMDAAEKLLGLTPLSRKATPAAKIARLRQIRNQAKNLTFDVCYRNATALELRSKASQQADELAEHAKDPNYPKPSLIYGQTTIPCQPTPISRDTRTASEKAEADKQTTFDRTFGAQPPATNRVSFRIVGILPQLGSLTDAQGADSFIRSFFTTSLGEGWFMSREAALQHPTLKPLVTDPIATITGAPTIYVDFKTREIQKRFIDEQGCDMSRGFSPPTCLKQGKLPLNPFGNPLSTLYDLGQGFQTLLRYLLGIIAALSAIVLMGTIGKVIADSRKETSVFRAVGAKRLDIAQVYLSYTAILASLSFLIALSLGIAIALFLEFNYSPGLSAEAVLAFNTHDLGKTFHLIQLYPLDLAAIYAFVLLVSLISAAIPLLTNLRRNPIKDMREE